MNTTIDNTQRKFLVQSQGFGTQKDIFCNLHDIPFILSEYFEKNEQYKVYEYWNRKLTNVSKARLVELFKANQITGQTVKTIDVTALQWFDKVNGNSYFAGTIIVNAGLKSEKKITMPFQYGYGDSFKHEAFKQLEQTGIINGVKHYSNGSSEDYYTYYKRNSIEFTSRKHENCKKSELKSI